MHIAQTLILLWAIKRGLPRIFSLSVVYELLLLISTLFFGWHYLADDLAGILVAYLAVKASIMFEKEKTEPEDLPTTDFEKMAEDCDKPFPDELEPAKIMITEKDPND